MKILYLLCWDRNYCNLPLSKRLNSNWRFRYSEEASQEKNKRLCSISSSKLTWSIRPKHSCRRPRYLVIWHRQTILKKLKIIATAKKLSGKLKMKVYVSSLCCGFTKYMMTHIEYDMKTRPIMLMSIQFHPDPKYWSFPMFFI